MRSLIAVVIDLIYSLILCVLDILIINPFTPIILFIMACIGICDLVDVDDKDVFGMTLIVTFSNSYLLMAAIIYGEYRISGCSLLSVFC